jgi:Mycotoxin biosynthesis protein UstYa
MELLRLNAMCRPDLTLGTFRWFGSRPTPVLTHMAQCVDFDRLNQWTAERKVNLYDLDSLADRPPTEEWEPKDHAVILGEKMGEAGQVEGFSKALLDAEPQLIDDIEVES